MYFQVSQFRPRCRAVFDALQTGVARHAAHQDHQQRRADQVERAERAKQRRVADLVGQRAHHQRKSKPADPRRHARKARRGADFAGLEHVGGQCVDERGNHLVREAADAEERNGFVRRSNQPDARRTDHHECAQHDARDARPDERHAQPLHQERRQITTEQTAEIRREERQPREHRDLLQVHVALSGEIERNPEAEGLPSRLGEKARLRDRPETARAEHFADAALVLPVGGGRRLPFDDGRAFFLADPLVVGRRAIEHVPERRPHETQRARHGKRTLPAVAQ